MPVEIIMQRRGEIFVPAWPQDAEEAERVPERRLVTARISRTVPDKTRAWYRTLLGRLCDATEAWPDPQEAHHALLLRCGFFDSCLVTDWGDIRFTAPSTREWDEIKWRTYLDRLFPIVVNEIIPEIGERNLRDAIKVMIGIDTKEIFEEGRAG